MALKQPPRMTEGTSRKEKLIAKSIEIEPLKTLNNFYSMQESILKKAMQADYKEMLDK
jgi:hypothetical protein